MSKKSSGGLFSFEKMITPKIITLVFAVSTIVIGGAGILGFLVFLFSGQIMAALLSPVVAAILILAGRIGCELTMVAFSMDSTLKEILKNQIAAKPTTDSVQDER